MALGEKERLLREVEKEREVWRQRDRALATVLQEKDQLTQNLRQELERCQVMLAGAVFPRTFLVCLFFFIPHFQLDCLFCFKNPRQLQGFTCPAGKLSACDVPSKTKLECYWTSPPAVKQTDKKKTYWERLIFRVRDLFGVTGSDPPIHVGTL